MVVTIATGVNGDDDDGDGDGDGDGEGDGCFVGKVRPDGGRRL